MMEGEVKAAIVEVSRLTTIPGLSFEEGQGRKRMLAWGSQSRKQLSRQDIKTTFTAEKLGNDTGQAFFLMHPHDESCR